ncbi:MAG: thioredoxin family protein [Thermoanaerobaculaceae bacterium]
MSMQTTILRGPCCARDFVVICGAPPNSFRVASRYGIQSIPTLLFFKGGQVVDRMVGGQHRKDDIKKKLLALV